MREMKYDLENRFVEFVARVIEVVEALPKRELVITLPDN